MTDEEKLISAELLQRMEKAFWSHGGQKGDAFEVVSDILAMMETRLRNLEEKL